MNRKRERKQKCRLKTSVKSFEMNLYNAVVASVTSLFKSGQCAISTAVVLTHCQPCRDPLPTHSSNQPAGKSTERLLRNFAGDLLVTRQSKRRYLRFQHVRMRRFDVMAEHKTLRSIFTRKIKCSNALERKSHLPCGTISCVRA